MRALPVHEKSSRTGCGETPLIYSGSTSEADDNIGSAKPTSKLRS